MTNEYKRKQKGNKHLNNEPIPVRQQPFCCNNCNYESLEVEGLREHYGKTGH